MRFSCALLVLAMLAGAVSVRAEEVCRVWQDRTYEVPFPRAEGEIVYDSHRNVIVFVGGGQTWEWDGTSWTQRTEPGPSERDYFSLTFDEFRGITVLFGGWDRQLQTVLAETWEWDGSSWQLREAAGPSARSSHAAVFDPIRQEILILGGSSAAGLMSDAWTWNGIEWVQLPTTGLPPRYDHQMVFDTKRSALLVLGGISGPSWTWMSDIWAWDGTSWILSAAALNPDVDLQCAVFDQINGVTLMFDYEGRTWAFDGEAWLALTGPSQRSGDYGYYLALAYDPTRARVISYGYYSRDDADLFQFSDSSWRPIASSGPSARFLHSMAYDGLHQQVVMFGGRGFPTYLGDTWTWDGQFWSLAALAGPSPRQSPAMAFDSIHGVTVLFGGRGPEYEDVTAHCCSLGGTFEWDGIAWTQLDVPGPGKRHGHAMAYDEARGVTVLFGGHFQPETYPEPPAHDWGDTWIWDGAEWTELQVEGPAPQAHHAMAYDPIREVTVLFGRSAFGPDSEFEAETWEWNGAEWSKRDAPGPPGHTGPIMYFDSHHKKVALMINSTNWTTPGEVWEWDGLSWHPRASLPLTRRGYAAAHDSLAQRLVTFGGADQSNWLSETWVYELDNLPADCDADCDVDLFDFAMLQTCVGDMEADPSCEQLDVDGSGWIDAADFAELFAMPTGPYGASD